MPMVGVFATEAERTPLGVFAGEGLLLLLLLVFPPMLRIGEDFALVRGVVVVVRPCVGRLGAVSGVVACTHCGELHRVLALHAVAVAVLLCVG